MNLQSLQGTHGDWRSKTRINFGEHEAVEAFCFLQIMKLVLGLVSEVKGRRNAFLPGNKRQEHFYFSVKQMQGTLAGAHGFCGVTERR